MWCLILVVDGMFNKSTGIATLSAAQTVMAAMMELHDCLTSRFWACHHCWQNGINVLVRRVSSNYDRGRLMTNPLVMMCTVLLMMQKH